MTREYIPTLDGWRAVAIALVLISHYAGATHSPIMVLYGLAGLGVSIFFGLSGYLICTLLLNEWADRGTISLRNFYRKRTFRIFPVAYTFLLVLSVARFFIKIPTNWHDIWPAMLFIRNYTYPNGGAAQHFWSLAIEEHFYLMLPAVMLIAKKQLLAVLISGSIVIFFWRIWIGYVPDHFYRTDLRIDAILGGCIVAVLVQRYPQIFLRIGSMKLLTASLALLILSHFTGFSLSRSLVSIAIPFILLSTILTTSVVVFSFFEFALLRWVGRLSYSIYIWQGLFTGNGKFLLGMPWYLNFVLLIGVSALSFYCLEQPLIRLGRRSRVARPGPVLAVL
jgi:peptidoglycan/LPS O-acetylase OafA/YrhL